MHGRTDRRRTVEKNADSVLVIERLPLGTLKLDPRNPRHHSDRQIRQIARSIKAFGFNVPILIDQNGKVVAGHGRYRAAELLGIKAVPTIRLDHLTEAQAKAFMIADNRLSETSEWDEQLLAESLRELCDLELNFSIDATGFEMGEIDLKIESLDDDASAPDDGADVVPSPATRPAVSLPGDLWLLNEHRILCGNALDTRAYEALMAGKRAAMVFCDPPYNVKIDGHASGLGRTHHPEFVMASGEMSEAEFASFLTLACARLARNSLDGSIHFICMDWGHAGELITAGRTAYSELKNICVWVKHNAGMGSFYRSQHELVFVFKAGRGPHRNNVQLGQFGRHRTNVWSYPGANSFGRATDEGHLLALHPTVKPVRLVADAILDCSDRRDIVLDSFLGSGTTLIAAERVGRTCYGMEIDPTYVDTVVRRWQAYAGGEAIHAVTARRFNDSTATMEARHG
jgi:DNA modification methylase